MIEIVLCRVFRYGIQKFLGVYSTPNQAEHLWVLEVLDGHSLGLAFSELSTEGRVEHWEMILCEFFVHHISLSLAILIVTAVSGTLRQELN